MSSEKNEILTNLVVILHNKYFVSSLVQLLKLRHKLYLVYLSLVVPTQFLK